MDALGEAKTTLRQTSSLLGPYWRNWWRIALVTLAAAAIPLIAYGLDRAHLPPIVSLLGSFAALVPVVTTAVRSATVWTNERMAVLTKAEAQIRNSIERDVADKEQKVAAAERALGDTRQRLATERARMESLEASATERDRHVEELTAARVLVEFADKRSSDYRQYLGLLSTIRDDLRTVQEEVRENNGKLRAGAADADRSMPNRIVLYIDDLDRCPPDKVVQVLEAVHLLLTFELFVVVVAVDTRWLRSALTQQLRALTRADQDTRRPTPGDYLEKIFQLPYWVQPLTPEARSQLVHGLLAGSVRTPDGGGPGAGGQSDLRVGDAETEALRVMLDRPGSALRIETSQLALTQEDLEFLESLAPIVGDTPRRVKRFVNTCQLLLAMRPPASTTGPFPSDRQVVCLLAAVNAGSAQAADALCAAVEADKPGTLASFVTGTDPVQAAHWTPLGRWLDKHQEWKNVPLTRLGVRLGMVRRLRFEAPTQPA
jgi:hypothetical protein